MRAKLLSVAVALVALAAAPAPALAGGGGSGGSGGFQAGLQSATTQQAAAGVAKSDQNAVNANVPVSIAGGNVTSGPSSANQAATSTATTDVSNTATTDQDQKLKQEIGGNDGCYAGCGGAGGFQAGLQKSDTEQLALGASKSDQNAVNANVPVSVAGGDVKSGPSSASQQATSTATTDVSNDATTNQDQKLKQEIGGSSSCKAGCGGAGGFQAGIQDAQTQQAAAGLSKSHQNAVNANVPVSVAGGDVKSGPSSANQAATSTATTDVSNTATTDQDQRLKQDIGGKKDRCGCDGKYGRDGYDGKDGGKDGCYAGCGGAGGFQAGVQKSETAQWALGISKSDQNAVNANVPVAIAGGDVKSGPSSANQEATSTATTDVSNDATTYQDQSLKQEIGGSSSCKAGCGGPGGFQLGLQKSDTEQWALGASKSDQNAVNANTPVSVAGGNIYAGPSSANQIATSTATTDVSNTATTDQYQSLKQDIGRDGKDCHDRCDGKGGYDGKDCHDRCDGKDGHDGYDGKDGGKDGCYAGCGGAGGFQLGVQKSDTAQLALGFAKSDQNAVNANAPVAIAGGDVKSGPSSANQIATSTATTDVSNDATTYQDQKLKQEIGGGKKHRCGCDGKDGHDGYDGYDNYDRKGKDGKDGKDRCYSGCGGAGGFQAGLQLASTKQLAVGLAKSDQNAVNGNAPHSVAGGNIYDGPSSANQEATSTATTEVSNWADTHQNQWQWQELR